MNLRTKISEGRSERGSFFFEAWKILKGRVWKHSLVGTPLWGALLDSTRWNLSLRIPTRSFLLGRTLPIDLLIAWKAIVRMGILWTWDHQGGRRARLTPYLWSLRSYRKGVFLHHTQKWYLFHFRDFYLVGTLNPSWRHNNCKWRMEPTKAKAEWPNPRLKLGISEEEGMLSFEAWMISTREDYAKCVLEECTYLW